MKLCRKGSCKEQVTTTSNDTVGIVNVIDKNDRQ